MTAFRRPRGPLPVRVYWLRRVVVLGLALVLVTSLALMLRLVSDGSESGALTPAAGEQPVADPLAPATVTTTVTATATPAATPTEEPAAEPTGTCENSDVVVSPIIYRAEAGRRSAVVLELRTRDTRACYWQASSESLALNITRPSPEEGRLPLEIWDTRRCPDAVPTRNLIVRRDSSVKIAVRWSGRRADAECSAAARWAFPGWYQLEVAALAGEPRELLFELRTPSPIVVTKTPDPQSPAGATAGGTGAEDSEQQGQTPEQQPTDEPLGPADGAVEPNG